MDRCRVCYHLRAALNADPDIAFSTLSELQLGVHMRYAHRMVA
jgi:hypothetical protein